MGWEYQLNYLTPKLLSRTELDLLQKSLHVVTDKRLKVELIKTENETFEYGFNFSDVAKHEWIWDGHLYLNNYCGLLVFHEREPKHISFIIQFLKNLFREKSIEIIIEEL